MLKSLFVVRVTVFQLILVFAVVSFSLLVVSPMTRLVTPSLISIPAAGSVAFSSCDLPLGLHNIGGSVAAHCGTLIVPLDHDHPENGKTVTLSFAVLDPLNPNATGLPIFHFEGGPGAGAITQYEQVWFTSYNLFRQNHPVVLIDQRGMGVSSPINCPEISGQAIKDLATASTTDQDNQTQSQRLATCQTRLAKSTDTQFFTSEALADDTDAVRAELGYDQILIYSNSYGTDLAQFYLRRHGEHVAGAVLDSAVGPDQDFALNAPVSGQASFDRVVALCNADPQCKQAYPDIPGALQKALSNLKNNPVTFAPLTDPNPIAMTGDRLLGAIFQMLYSSSNYSVLPISIAQAARGNYLTIGAVLLQVAEQEQISEGAYYSIVCAEQVAFFNPTLVNASTPPDTNLFKSLFMPDALQKACQNWHYAKLTAVDVAPVKSDRPVLILVGDLDPITPVSYAQAIHANLSHSTLITFPYEGHGVIVNSLCAQQITASFFDSPLKAVDSTCAAKDLKPIFQGAYSIPLAPYTTPDGRQTVQAPKGWAIQSPTDTDPLTYFTSPDGLMVSATGAFANQTASDLRARLIKALTARYGTLLGYDDQSSSIGGGSQILVYFANYGGQIDIGTLVLYQVGNNVGVFWHSSPAVWAAATLSALQNQLTSVVQLATTLK